ncbi:pleiotropic drug resistance protein 2-like isoform X2 [Iris pallida]|uniref:Pleiotropic drug resistance protein 2-like isoform X2 n=1 Tax=Iris pallida TaxID=29817 RepID=A0AAX6FYA8_IRIPA|nr:pleiotropic drug resistance protein 2-like isoform X2 [Iris pallida]
MLHPLFQSAPLLVPIYGLEGKGRKIFSSRTSLMRDYFVFVLFFYFPQISSFYLGFFFFIYLDDLIFRSYLFNRDFVCTNFRTKIEDCHLTPNPTPIPVIVVLLRYVGYNH